MYTSRSAVWISASSGASSEAFSYDAAAFSHRSAPTCISASATYTMTAARGVRRCTYNAARRT